MFIFVWTWGGTEVYEEGGAPLLSNEGRMALARGHAPLFLFSIDERTFPAPVYYFLERSVLVERSGTVVAQQPGGKELAQAGPHLFLDNVFGKGNDQGVIERYEEERGSIEPTVYVHVVEDDGRVAIQYWLFYVFNLGTYNSHEGDWEMVQVVLDRETLDPLWVAFSQHHSRGLTEWDERIAVRNGTHPLVLVARGSHANYPFGQAVPRAGDHIDGEGETWAPGDYELVPVGPEWGEEVPGWLLFRGAWGEPAGAWGGLLGKEGPPGPMFREQGSMWVGLS